MENFQSIHVKINYLLFYWLITFSSTLFKIYFRTVEIHFFQQHTIQISSIREYSILRFCGVDVIVCIFEWKKIETNLIGSLKMRKFSCYFGKNFSETQAYY